MPKTVLVVDDESILVEISKRKLIERGFEVMTASDGEEALAQLEKKIPDLIILDIQMPHMNGYTFMMEKNKVPAYETIPVIVISSHNEMEPLFKRHNVRAYLLKPTKLQELLEKVTEVLGPA
jgi:chemosensory pili system protein ChpA (sensor histidine kinase/response regulator)